MLTATIDPGDTPYVTIRDPRSRLDDYHSAIGRWLSGSLSFREIHLIENSGHSLVGELVDHYGDSVTVQTFALDQGLGFRGKGFGEAVLLHRFAEHTSVHSTYVVKCTGRLYVRNARRLLGALKTRPDIVVRITRDLSFADSRFFGVRKDLFAPLVANLSDEVDDATGVYLEHALARRILSLAGQGARVAAWPAPPFFVGRSASTGERYDSFGKKLRWPVQLLLNRLSQLSKFP